MAYERIVVIVFLVFFVLEFCIERVLSAINSKFGGDASRIHTRRAESNHRSRDARKKFRIHARPHPFRKCRGALEHLVLKLLFLFTGLLPWLSAQSARFVSNEYLSGAAFLFAFGFIGAMARTPLDLYSTFKIEAKFTSTKPHSHLASWTGSKLRCSRWQSAPPFIAALVVLTLNHRRILVALGRAVHDRVSFLMLILYPMLIAPLLINCAAGRRRASAAP